MQFLRPSLLQENFINLPGLLFSCKYRVTVHTLSAKRRSKDESIFFLTPSCATLQSKSAKPVACPGDTRKHRDAYHSLESVCFQDEALYSSYVRGGRGGGHVYLREHLFLLLYYSLLWLHITFTYIYIVTAVLF